MVCDVCVCVCGCVCRKVARVNPPPLGKTCPPFPNFPSHPVVSMTNTQLLEDMILRIEVGSQFFTRTWQALRMSLGKPEAIFFKLVCMILAFSLHVICISDIVRTPYVIPSMWVCVSERACLCVCACHRVWSLSLPPYCLPPSLSVSVTVSHLSGCKRRRILRAFFFMLGHMTAKS